MTSRHDILVEFQHPLGEFIQDEPENESPFNTTTESSLNITKETLTELPSPREGDEEIKNNSDPNATIYAGVVIGLIVLLVIALMLYLSREKVGI